MEYLDLYLQRFHSMAWCQWMSGVGMAFLVAAYLRYRVFPAQAAETLPAADDGDSSDSDIAPAQ